MKTLFQCGLCLVLGLWISRAAADELQFRAASSSPTEAENPAHVPPITDVPGSSTPSVRLMKAIPLDPQTDGDSIPMRPPSRSGARALTKKSRRRRE